MNRDSEVRGVVRRSNAMRKYGALLLAAAVFCAILAVAPRTAHACSCVDRPLSEYADDVVVAFAGSQIERILPEPGPDGVWSSMDPVTLVFEVERVYKGRAGSQIALRTNRSGASCGVDFGRRGGTGVVAFDIAEGLYSVGLCGSPVTIAELEEVFGDGYPPDPIREAEALAREAEVLALEAKTLAREAELQGPRPDVPNTAQILLTVGVLVIVAGIGIGFRRVKKKA